MGKIAPEMYKGKITEIYSLIEEANKILIKKDSEGNVNGVLFISDVERMIEKLGGKMGELNILKNGLKDTSEVIDDYNQAIQKAQDTLEKLKAW